MLQAILLVALVCIAKANDRSTSGIAAQAVWHTPQEVWLSSLVSLTDVAREILRVWNLRVHDLRPHIASHCLQGSWLLRKVHREAGRVFKMLVQLAAVAYLVQQFQRACPFCKASWNQCTCQVCIDPQAGLGEVKQCTHVHASCLPFQGPLSSRMIWPVLSFIERVRSVVYTHFVSTSQSKHDKSVYCFIEMLRRKFPAPSVTSCGNLYGFFAPWSRAAYLGETSTTCLQRWKKHRSAMTSMVDKGRLYSTLRRMGMARFVFVPLAHIHACAPSKRDRVFLEAQCIALLKPSENVQGMTHCVRPAQHTEVLLPRVAKDRTVMSLRGVIACHPAVKFNDNALLLPSTPLQQGDWHVRLQTITLSSYRGGRCGTEGMLITGLLASS